MSSPAKITFGNNPATSYTLKYKFVQRSTNPNFAYQSGDQITNSYSPYNLPWTSQNVAATTSYSGYEAPREATYANYQTQPYSTSFSSGQVTSPVLGSYESGKNVTYASPAAKVTFGGKSYTPSYAPTSSTYQANYHYGSPAQYQTYQAYQHPVEITTQPIRNEVREEVVVDQPKVETVPEVRRSNVGATVSEPAKETKTKGKKGGCPSWLWPLLGILALLALILGLLFGLGVFGRIGGGAVATPTVTDGTTAATTKETTTETKTQPTTATPTTTGAVTTTTETPTTSVTTPTGYTVTQETTVSKKDNVTTTGVTAPTVEVTTPTVNVTTPSVPSFTPPTVNVTNPIIPTTSVDDFSIDPTAVSPIPVATTTQTTVTVPASTTNWSSTTGTSLGVTGTTYPTVTTARTGTTYPTGSYSGYGSNPALGTTGVSTTSSGSSASTPYVDYVVPTSAY